MRELLEKQIDKLLQNLEEKLNHLKEAIKKYMEENIVSYALKHNKNMLKEYHKLVDNDDESISSKEVLGNLVLEFLREHPQIIDLNLHSDSVEFGSTAKDRLEELYYEKFCQLTKQVKALQDSFSDERLEEILHEMQEISLFDLESGLEFYELMTQKSSKEDLNFFTTKMAKEFLYKLSKVDFEYICKFKELLFELKEIVEKSSEEEK